MNQYLEDTKYASSEIIRLIRGEEAKLFELRKRHDFLRNHHEVLYQDFLRKDLDRNENFTEGQMMHSFIKKIRFYQEKFQPVLNEIIQLEISVYTKKESIETLSGSLLQIAKQGISLTYGGLTDCPFGRFIKNESLKNIIWQARNQSLHYEEGRYRQAVIDCFNNLGIELTRKNHAKKILDLLEWINYQSYEEDMKTLLW